MIETLKLKYAGHHGGNDSVQIIRNQAFFSGIFFHQWAICFFTYACMYSVRENVYLAFFHHTKKSISADCILQFLCMKRKGLTEKERREGNIHKDRNTDWPLSILIFPHISISYSTLSWQHKSNYHTNNYLIALSINLYIYIQAILVNL